MARVLKTLGAPGRRELERQGYVDYTPEFLTATEASQLQRTLVETLRWEQREIVLFGKSVLQPRLIAWAGVNHYRYSGQTLEPRAAPATLEAIRARVAQHGGFPFNHVLINRYRDGNDSMGLHADNEPELSPRRSRSVDGSSVDSVWGPTIATLSLGATRRFVVVSRRNPRERLEYQLEHGSLLLMGGSSQKHYVHGVPKDPKIQGERLSLTFRQVFFEPATL